MGGARHLQLSGLALDKVRVKERSLCRKPVVWRFGGFALRYASEGEAIVKGKMRDRDWQALDQ